MITTASGCEYVEMLENQIAKSNNGIVRTKLLTFGVNVDDLPPPGQGWNV